MKAIRLLLVPVLAMLVFKRPIPVRGWIGNWGTFFERAPEGMCLKSV